MVCISYWIRELVYVNPCNFVAKCLFLEDQIFWLTSCMLKLDVPLNRIAYISFTQELTQFAVAGILA